MQTNLVIKQPNKYLTLTLITILIITFMIFVDSGYAIASILIYAIFIALSLILPIEYTLYLVAVLSPINRVFLLPSSNLTIIPVLIIIFVIKHLVFKRIFDKRFIVLLVPLIIVNLFSAYVINHKIINTVYYFIYLVFAYFIATINNKDIFINTAKYYILGTLISCIGGLQFENIANSVQNYRYIEYGFYRYMGLLYDATEFGQKVLVAIAFTISLMMISKSKKIIYGLILIIFIYFLVLSGTRSTLLGLILITTYILIKYLKNKKVNNNKKIIVLLLLIPIVIFSFYQFIFLNLMGLRVGTNEVFFTDRFDIWTKYFYIFMSELTILLFGIGGGNIQLFSKNMNYITLHNGFFEIIFEFGTLGSILIFTILYSIINFTNAKKNFYNYLPLFCYLTTLFSLGITRSELFFILIGISGYEVGKNTNNE